MYNFVNTTLNSTGVDVSNVTETPVNWTSLTEEMCKELGGVTVGEGCGNHFVPDVFFLSLILFVFTFAIAWFLKEFKTSAYFPSFVSSSILLLIILFA